MLFIYIYIYNKYLKRTSKPKEKLMTHQSVGLYSTHAVQRMHAVENLRMSCPECPLLVLKFNHQNE